MKGRAPKVSCSSQKVGGNTWRPFWRSVKNAQFHPTKHLSRWVPKLEVERYSTPSIFSAHWHFRLFCSRWPSFLRNDHWGDDKAYLWSVVKNSRYDRFTDIQTLVRARAKRPFPGQRSEMNTLAIKRNMFFYIFPTTFVFRYVHFFFGYVTRWTLG